MKSNIFKLSNLVLYAKGQYKISENVWEDYLINETNESDKINEEINNTIQYSTFNSNVCRTCNKLFDRNINKMNSKQQKIAITIVSIIIVGTLLINVLNWFNLI